MELFSLIGLGLVIVHTTALYSPKLSDHRKAKETCRQQGLWLLSLKDGEHREIIERQFLEDTGGTRHSLFWLGINLPPKAKSQGKGKGRRWDTPGPDCPLYSFTNLKSRQENCASPKGYYCYVEKLANNTRCTHPPYTFPPCLMKQATAADWYHARQNCYKLGGRLPGLKDLQSQTKNRRRRDSDGGRRGRRRPPPTARPRPVRTPRPDFDTDDQSEESSDGSSHRRHIPIKTTTKIPPAPRQALVEEFWLDLRDIYKYTSWNVKWESGEKLDLTSWAEDEPGLWLNDHCVAANRSLQWFLKPCFERLAVYCHKENDKNEFYGRSSETRHQSITESDQIDTTAIVSTQAPTTTIQPVTPLGPDQDNSDLIGIYIGAASGVIVVAIIVTGVAVYVCLRRRHKKNANSDNLNLPEGMTLAEYQSLGGSLSYLHPYHEMDGNTYDRVSSLGGFSNISYAEPINSRSKSSHEGLRSPSTRYGPAPAGLKRNPLNYEYSQHYRRDLPASTRNNDKLHATPPFIQDLPDGSRRIDPDYMTTIADVTPYDKPYNQRQSLHSYLDLQEQSVRQDYLTNGVRRTEDRSAIWPRDEGYHGRQPRDSYSRRNSEEETSFSLDPGHNNRHSVHSYLDIVTEPKPLSRETISRQISESSGSSGNNSRRTRSSRSKSDSGISDIFMVNDDIVY